MKVVIIAGGKGTRIESINKDIPKAMLPVCNKPVLEYQIELAKRYGLNDFIVIVGHLGHIIKDYFGNGEKWGVSISYYTENIPLGTSGALHYLKEDLQDDFLVFYGDTIMDINLDQFIDYHKSSNADATLFLHPNDHPYDSDLVEINEHSQITAFYPKPHREGSIYRNLVNAALYILSSKIIDCIPENLKTDFGKDIFPKCLEEELKLLGYVSPEYIKDMGTPNRFNMVSQDIESGKVARLNRSIKRKAVFLDRDGVINIEKNLLSKEDDLELISGVANAIKRINQSGYLAIIVTNQPVIARNLCSIDDLRHIHNKLETLLGDNNAFVDAIYFCPHHPDSGFPEERKEYKITCSCRKPKPGMILKAANDFNIELSESYMIGDRIWDIEAGRNAGIINNILIPSNTANALLDVILNEIKL